jgi:hypothetical protein
MLKRMAMIVGIGIAAVAPDLAAAQDLEFIGYTTTARSGQAGVLAFHQECAALGRPGARACTSADIIGTSVPSDIFDRNAASNWVLPSFVESVGNLVVDASGKSGSPTNLSCDGWNSQASTVTGLAMVDSGGQLGRFLLSTCNGLRNIACCAPVEPE